MAAPIATPESTTDTQSFTHIDSPWVTVVWDDPINLMSYVAYVFQKYFGYSKAQATRLMLDVHHKGKAVVSSGVRERMELDVMQMHSYGLWATLQRGSE